jgi:uncharacterized phiE125 gp8 family phage protein
MRYETETSGLEPIPMQLVKDHLRVTWSEEDVLIYSFVSAAREYVERSTSQAVIPQTITAYYSAMPRTEGYLELPLSNAVSITSVKYIDGTGAQQTVPGAEYYLTVGQPNRVYFLNGYDGSTERLDSVEIVYTAGYGETPYKALPQTIVAAMLIMVADLYENREAQSSQKYEQNQTVDRLLNQNRELAL